jgi:N4-gp56 family major capsid protein
MQFYGTYILLNEQVTLQAQDPVLNEAAQRLGVSLRQTEDQLMRDMLLSSSAFFNSIAGTDGDVPTEITRSDIDGVIKALRGNNGYSFVTGVEGENRFGTAPVRDAYFSLGHTNMIGQLDNITGFVNKWQYPNQQSTLESEWGSVANLRFLLSSVGSITSSGSALGNDVMNNFVCAREAFAAIEQDGYSSRFIYRPPIYDGPLGLNVSLGWTMAEVPRILNDAWVFNLRCTAA